MKVEGNCPSTASEGSAGCSSLCLMKKSASRDINFMRTAFIPPVKWKDRRIQHDLTMLIPTP